MARPASAQEVVEAIRAIERELLAERQKAELSQVAPRPGDVDALKQLEVGIEKGPLEPRPSVRPGDGRRTRWITAAVLGTAAFAAVGSFVFAPLRKTRLGIVAHRSTSVSASDERAVAEATATRPKGPEPSQPEAVADRRPTGPETVDRLPEALPKARDSSPVVKTGDERPGPEQREPKGSPGA